jgi:uncharacterized membrane protein YedE/YeeE
MLSKPYWSPYLCGAVIGLLQIPAFLLADQALGTSSSYVYLVGHLAALFGEVNPYLERYMIREGITWQVGMVVGIIFGAWFSAMQSKMLRKDFSDIYQLHPGFFSEKKNRKYSAFIGGFLILFGARLAGGCTSGHGLSGIAQLSVSSILATVSMFAGGILFAMIFKAMRS